MPHVLKMKDGKLLTPFGIRDLLEAVSDYAGEELAREIESYINTNVADIDDYEKEYDRMEQDIRVTVPQQSPLKRYLHAAQYQTPPGRHPVDVVPVTDPHA